MLFYYDNNGKLVTISPHGEIPRQGGALVLYVLMNKNFNDNTNDPGEDGTGMQNRMMTARFKCPSEIVYSEDYPMALNEDLWEFKKLPGESIGSLIDGETYYLFTVDLSDTYANKEAGNLDIVFTLYKYELENDEPVIDTSMTINLGKATVFIEETLGLAPYSGVGMTYTEYQSLMAYLNQYQNTVNTLSSYVDTLASTKADRNNSEQDIVAFELTAENIFVSDLYHNGATITLDSAFGGITFKPSGSNKYITISSGQIKGIDTILNNTDATNKQYVDNLASTKADLTNRRQIISANQIILDAIHDGNNTTEIEMLLNEVRFNVGNARYSFWENGFDVGENIIKNLGTPTASNNAATKGYVDNIYSSVVHKSGTETIDGNKTFNGAAIFNDVVKITTITNDTDSAINKNYVDENFGNTILLSIDSDYKLIATLKNIKGDIISTSSVIDLPLESVVVNGSYDSVNKKIVLTLENGSTIEFSVADLISGLQSEINVNNKLSADLVDDTNTTNKFITYAQSNQIATNTQSINDIIVGTTVVGEAEKATKDNVGNVIKDTYMNRTDAFSVGMIEVSNYNENTGEITLDYNSNGVSSIVYDDDTGIVTFTY